MNEKLKKVKGEKNNSKYQNSHRTSHNSGITLVALIITIIVLLILAVVAIRAVQGDGIIQHAKNAQTRYEQEQAKELGILSGYELELAKNSPASLSDDMTTTEFSKTTFVKDEKGKTFVVPAGYTIVKDDTTANTVEVDKGVVITDGTSQFVWIPVSNINNMVMCQTHRTAQTLNQTTLQCPECGTNTKLAGKLYATSLGENFNASLTEQTYTKDSGLREPDNLTSSSYGDNASRFTGTNVTYTSTLYQERFNKMVESVAKYGGFYVGRYETSLNGTTAQSKARETPMNNINWWKMYANSETYAPESSNKSVVSEMIWGCQWDAMLKYILDTADASHVTAKTNVGHTSSDFTSKPYQTGGTNYSTVYNETVNEKKYGDKAANIYDLEGNVCEWTQEADDALGRIPRGGSCSYRVSPSGRYSICPTSFDSNYGSRLSLYIK